jgi:hypothetical protein
MRINIQKLRKGTKHQSYRIALPKSLIEAKNWQDKDFKLEDKGGYLILKPVKK